jgi:two-component system sensor histidine kinase KdpD
MVEGLPMVARREVVYRGARLEEMDLDALLARRPQVALVDELAHTNAPGCRHGKRWQDIEELLAAGIDVITTLNIQHLESLNDVVRQITGVVQHETVPDEVARRADQIELVDMTPEALRRRMVHGNVYPADRIEAALTHYFRPGNLTALRELALLWVADRVEEGLRRYRAEHGIAAGWETRERILVALGGGPEGETLIRRAARITERVTGADLVAVHVLPGDGLSGHDLPALAKQRALVESLGGEYHQIVGDDVATALLQFAQTQNTTQIVLGAGRRGVLASRLSGEGLGARVIRLSGPIDVLVVTHEQAAGPPSLRLPRAGRGMPVRRVLAGLGLSAVLLPALTVVLTALRAHLTLSSDTLLYLLVVVAVALVGGVYPALATAVVAALLVDFYFVVPVHTLVIANLNDLLTLGVFCVVAALLSAAVQTAARQTRRALRASAEAAALGALAGSALDGGNLPGLLEQVRQLFGLDAVSLLNRDRDSGASTTWYVAASCGEKPPEHPEDADVTVPAGEGLVLAGRGHPPRGADQRVLVACAAQIAITLTRRQLSEHAADADEHLAADQTRGAELLAVQHALREPLAQARAAVDQLATPGPLDGGRRQTLAGNTQTCLAHLTTALTDLDDLAQARAGALDIHLRPVDIDEVLSAALGDLGPGGHDIVLDMPEDTPDVIADANLLARVLTNLATHAAGRNQPGTVPTIRVTAGPDHLTFDVIDHGPANDTAANRAEVALPTASLPIRVARDLAEAMGATVTATQTPGGGLTISLTMPRATGRWRPGAGR